MHAARHRDRREHDRNGAAQPGRGGERALLPAEPPADGGDQHRQRPRHRDQRSADEQRRQDGRAEPRWHRQQTEHDEQPDLCEPRNAVREPEGRAPVRKPCVAEGERRDVVGEEAARVDARRRGVRRQCQRHRRDRIETCGRQRRPA